MPWRPPVHQAARPRVPTQAETRARNAKYASYHSPEWRKVRAAVLERDAHRCRLRLPGCLTVATTVHHRVERSAGGRDVPSNLLSCCGPCHNRRHPEKGGAHGGF
jgi:5-methylcytosine-specific restriction endonuclease McrA